jgi:hypothetical protein
MVRVCDHICFLSLSYMTMGDSTILAYTANVYKTLVKGVFSGWICQSFRFPFGRNGQRLRCTMQKRTSHITDDDMSVFRDGGWLVHKLNDWTTAEITVVSRDNIDFMVSEMSISAINSSCISDQDMCVDVT